MDWFQTDITFVFYWKHFVRQLRLHESGYVQFLSLFYAETGWYSMDGDSLLVRQCKKSVMGGLLLIVLTTIATACTQPMNLLPLPEESPRVQVESPLLPTGIAALPKNPWRVVTIVYQNETVAFDAIAPIYVGIGPDSLSAETTRCNRLSFGLNSEGAQQYQLGEGIMTQMGCSEIREKQFKGLYMALSTTTAFELQDEQLTLIGAESRIVLEATHPFNLADPVFTQNRWQLIEIIEEEQPVIFDGIRPVYLEITEDGYLHFKTEQCNIATFRMDVKSDEYYQFNLSAHTAETCPQSTELQSSHVFQAVQQTNTLTLNGTQLLLTSADIRVVLEMSGAQ
jgi:heat shock protein HslJ